MANNNQYLPYILEHCEPFIEEVSKGDVYTIVSIVMANDTDFAEMLIITGKFAGIKSFNS